VRESYTISGMCYNIHTFGRGRKLKIKNGKWKTEREN
jgi:hypothetical protein